MDNPNSAELIPLYLRTLSYSSTLKLHKCPRRLQLYKMLGQDEDEESSTHFDYGHAVHAGVQKLIETEGDFSAAVFAAFLAWSGELDEELPEKKKSFWYALAAVDSFRPLFSAHFAEYELAVFVDPSTGELRPATELSFSIAVEEFLYRGFIDVVLKHRTSGELLVIEVKTTGNRNIVEEMYKNSMQGLNYAVVLDRIAHDLGNVRSAYTVIYCAYSSTALKWFIFPFKKAYSMRARFLLSLLQDVNEIKQQHYYSTMLGDGNFQMRGESCFDFFRPCTFFGVCELHNKRFEGAAKANLERLAAREPEHFTFNFNFEQLLEAQVAIQEAGQETGTQQPSQQLTGASSNETL